MSEKGTARFTVKGELVTKGKDFEIYRANVGPFEILRLNGKCTAKMLTELRDKLLKQSRNLALDIGSLSDAGFPLARELTLTIRRYRNSGRNIVFLNARGQFRDMLRASSPDGQVTFVPSEKMFEGEIPAFLKRMQEVRRQLGLIRTELENNPHWQLVDREQCWLCPFCARLLDHLRVNPRTLVHDVQIETIWLHLAEDCPDYREGKNFRPITELTEIVRRTNQDKLSASRTTANALAERVIHLQDQLKGAEELEESVKAAAERQRRLLPSKVPDIPSVVAALGYWPSNRVSGDFYDFLDLGEGRFAFLIGDVAGHGIEAGILMGVAKKVISIRMRDSGDPSLALQMANRDIYPDLDRKTFVSALLAVYDGVSRELTYVRAGHNPAVLFNPERPKQFTKLEASGLVLGLDPGPRFNQVMARDTVQLRAGDTIIFYTDGLIEAQNSTGEEFGLHRVYHQLRRQNDADPQDVLNGLYEQLNTFREGAPQEDDVTAFLLRFL